MKNPGEAKKRCLQRLGHVLNYSVREKQLGMMVTSNLQLKRLEEKVFVIDPNAFFIVENTLMSLVLALERGKTTDIPGKYR